jgi:hypothetical protein
MSAPEDLLLCQIKAVGLPSPVREHRFHLVRRWRFDFAWPPELVALEVEGGTWTGGRHVTGSGYAKDLEKYNKAAIIGWLVLRVTPEMIDDGRALVWLEEALALRGGLSGSIMSASQQANVEGETDGSGRNHGTAGDQAADSGSHAPHRGSGPGEVGRFRDVQEGRAEGPDVQEGDSGPEGGPGTAHSGPPAPPDAGPEVDPEDRPETRVAARSEAGVSAQAEVRSLASRKPLLEKVLRVMVPGQSLTIHDEKCHVPLACTCIPIRTLAMVKC